MLGRHGATLVERQLDEGLDGSATNPIVTAEEAHRYGVGISETHRYNITQRGLASLMEVMPDFLDQVARRAIQHGLQEALPPYWLRRAETFEKVGTPTADETAKACRRHAWLLATHGIGDEILMETPR